MDALRAWIRRLRMRSRVPATIEANDIILGAHNNADILSQKLPICSSCNGRCVLSSASQFRRRPDNSRSLMVMCPCGFVSMIRASWISCGHLSCHRNGVSF